MTGDNVKPGEAWSRAGAPGGDGPADHDRQRLLAMLARLRRARNTPLQFEGNREALAREVLTALSADVAGVKDDELRDGLHIMARLSALLTCSLRDEWPAERAGFDAEKAMDVIDATASGHTGHRPLAAWLERLQAAARATHPQALDLLELRVEGFDEHDIARRLGLGRRLVRSIARDLWMHWAGRPGEE